MIHPALVAGFLGASESAILPWSWRGRWIRAHPNPWACRSDQGLGAAPREGQIAQRKGRTLLEPDLGGSDWIRVQPLQAEPFWSTAAACQTLVEHAGQRWGVCD